MNNELQKIIENFKTKLKEVDLKLAGSLEDDMRRFYETYRKGLIAAITYYESELKRLN